MLFLHHAAAERKCKVEPFKPYSRETFALKQGAVEFLIGAVEEFSKVAILIPILWGNEIVAVTGVERLLLRRVFQHVFAIQNEHGIRRERIAIAHALVSGQAVPGVGEQIVFEVGFFTARFLEFIQRKNQILRSELSEGVIILNNDVVLAFFRGQV